MLAVTAIAVLVVYLGVVFVMMLGQRQLVFHPNADDSFANPVAPFSVVSVQTSDGLTLKGFYAPPHDARPVIIYFHGNAGTAADRIFKAQHFLTVGYGYLLIEYRGFGGNAGLPGEEEFYRDARAWLAFLNEQGITADRFVYYGESLGTGVAVQMVTETPPKAVVLEAPFTSVVDVGAYYYPFLPVRRLAQYRFDSLEKAAALTMPVLIYHGQRDITVPFRFGEKLFAAIPCANKKFVSFPQARHKDLYDFAAGETVLEFLNHYAP